MGRKLNMFLSVVCMAAAAAGCSQREPERVKEYVPFEEPQYAWEKNRGETLEVWGIYPEMERGYIQKAFKRYEDLTGDQLKVVQIPKDQFEDQVRSAFEGSGEKPDILLSYGGTNIEAYNPDENFYDFSKALWVDDLTDTSINQTVYNGRIVGLPHWEASISGTLYNKEIFDRYNLEIPENQEDFIELCEALKYHGITPMYMPVKEISMLLYQFPLDSIVEDPAVLTGLNYGRLGYQDIPDMARVADWYKTMADHGYLGTSYLSNDWAGMNDAMKSGKYAMMMCWDTWLYTDFDGDPSRFGLMPAFVGVPEKGTFEGPNLGMFLVNKNSPRLQTALNFITFLADPYNYNVAFEGVYTAPVFKNQVASISTPQYLEAERLIERNYRDSTAWLRIRGFSQMDAVCIVEYMSSRRRETAVECLERMDLLRNERLNR